MTTFPAEGPIRGVVVEYHEHKMSVKAGLSVCTYVYLDGTPCGFLLAHVRGVIAVPGASSRTMTREQVDAHRPPPPAAVSDGP